MTHPEVQALVADLAASKRPPSSWVNGPSGLSDVGRVEDYSFLDRPGPQPFNQIAGTMEAQMARLWNDLARREAGLPQPPPRSSAAKLAAIAFYHPDEVADALRPIVEAVVKEVLREMPRVAKEDGDGQAA